MRSDDQRVIWRAICEHCTVQQVNLITAMVLAERNERGRWQGDDKQRTPSPTEAPPEDFPVPAKKPQARDVIAQAVDAWFEVPNNGEAAHKYERRRMAAAAQVIVRALLARVVADDERRTYLIRATESINEAAHNLGLGLEV